MARPKQQRVGAHVFGIVYDPNIGDLGAMGATSLENASIMIDPRNVDSMVKETLVHETLHAGWKQTPLGITYPDIEKDSPGETIIQAISPLVYAWVRDNPGVIRWLQSL